MHMPEENKEKGTAPDAVSNDEKAVWFAMSAPYRRELRAKQFLEERDIECFVPMRYAIVEKGYGIKQRKMVPAIHNLIFVHTTKERIKRLKQGVDFLQYRTKPVNGKNIPIIVPDKQMSQFITATKEFNEDIIYLQPDEIDLRKGTRIRVHGGTMDGAEGIFMKIQGKRNRRVVILIEGVTAFATAEIAPDLIEVIRE
jgi:transcription antitermination factor NusG